LWHCAVALMYVYVPAYVRIFVRASDHLQTCWLIFFLGDEGFYVLTFRSTPCAKFAGETYGNDKMGLRINPLSAHAVCQLAVL